MMAGDDDVIGASRQTADVGAVVNALRAAVTSSAGVATRPGLLRVRLEAALRPEDERYMSVAHQVVAAAEENLPSLLAGLAPMTTESVDRVTAQLASTRGWSESTALRTVLIWADALGLERPPDIQIPGESAGFGRAVYSAGIGNLADFTMVPPPESRQGGTGDAGARSPLRAMSSEAGYVPTSLPKPALTNVALESGGNAEAAVDAPPDLNEKRRGLWRRG